jgi:hypothetical protein
MLGLIIPLVAGILFGFSLRERKRINLGKATTAIIVTLIFSLGFSIGSNRDLLEVMPRVGVNAVIIMLLAVFFSAVFMKVAGKAVRLR